MPTESVFEPIDDIDTKYPDMVMQTKCEALKAFFDKMNKDSAIASRPRFVCVSSYLFMN